MLKTIDYQQLDKCFHCHSPFEKIDKRENFEYLFKCPNNLKHTEYSIYFYQDLDTKQNTSIHIETEKWKLHIWLSLKFAEELPYQELSKGTSSMFFSGDELLNLPQNPTKLISMINTIINFS